MEWRAEWSIQVKTGSFSESEDWENHFSGVS